MEKPPQITMSFKNKLSKRRFHILQHNISIPSYKIRALEFLGFQISSLLPKFVIISCCTRYFLSNKYYLSTK